MGDGRPGHRHLSWLQTEEGRVASPWLSYMSSEAKKSPATLRLLKFVSLMGLSPKPKACNILFPAWEFPETEEALASVKKPVGSLFLWNYLTVSISFTYIVWAHHLKLLVHLLRKCIFHIFIVHNLSVPCHCPSPNIDRFELLVLSTHLCPYSTFNKLLSV